MNFVIFSYNFLPQNDAEAFCTARFANALATLGHSVQVVTCEWPSQVEEDVVTQLLDAPITIIRIPRKVPKRPPILVRIRFMTNEWMAADIPLAVKRLKSILKQTSNPILISRGNPATSNIVGFLCRKYAKKWVVHFSDPFPWFSSSLNEWLGKRWGRRMIQAADYCSITCPEAMRFFQETYQSVFTKSKAKFLITPHIGEPMVTPDSTFKVTSPDKCTIAHCGSISRNRGLQELLDSVRELNLEKPAVLSLFGPANWSGVNVPEDYTSMLQWTPSATPKQVSSITNTVDINVVTDLKTRLAYIPFLPSKFVYLLFSNKPIVAYTEKSSCISRLAHDFPEAGIFIAEMPQPNSLRNALQAALHSNQSFDRRRIQNIFSIHTIACNFINSIANDRP